MGFLQEDTFTDKSGDPGVSEDILPRADGSSGELHCSFPWFYLHNLLVHNLYDGLLLWSIICATYSLLT